MRKVPLVLLVGLLSTGAIGCPARNFTLPGYWVDEAEKLQPWTQDFNFDDLYFTSKEEGWIVGWRYLLRIQAGQPEVFFRAFPYREAFNVVQVAGERIWAGGSADDRPMLWHFSQDWRPVELPIERGQVTDLEFRSPQEGLALVTSGDLGAQQSHLLEYHGGEWRRIDLSTIANGHAQLRDTCYARTDAWMVGSTGDRDDRRGAPIAIARSGGKARAVPIPEIPGASVSLRRVECRARGGPFALGGVYSRGRSGIVRPVLLEYAAGAWREVSVPEPAIGEAIEISTMAAVGDDLLVALCGWSRGGSRAALYRYRQGRWTSLPAPTIDDGRGREPGNICLAQIFPIEDEIWAIANDAEGAGLAKGRIFHYREGRWRLRNWNWNRWQQPWWY